MNREIVLIILAGIILILSIAVILYQQSQLRDTYRQLNSMLEDAIKGDFQEKCYDESMLSKTAVKLKQFLVTSQLSQNNIRREKETVKALISDISHQTKTPITNILLYLQLLSEDEQLSKESRDNLELMKRQSEKLVFLLQALVKTSRLETGIITVNPEYGLINTAVLNAIEEIQGKAEQKGICLLNYIDNDFYASIDMKWTREAIYNVLDNAVKYTNPGGLVSITAKEYEMFIRLDIKDTGMGIVEEEWNKIFQRFYRSRDAASMEGVGIGLYLTRKILMEECGYIKVTSKPGEGTMFSLFFAKVPKEIQV